VEAENLEDCEEFVGGGRDTIVVDEGGYTGGWNGGLVQSEILRRCG